MPDPNPEMMPDRAPEVDDDPGRYAVQYADAIIVGIARHLGPLAPAFLAVVHHVMDDHDRADEPGLRCGINFSIAEYTRSAAGPPDGA